MGKYQAKKVAKKAYKKSNSNQPVVKELMKIVKMQKRMVEDTGLQIVNKPPDKIWTVTISDLENLFITNPVALGNLVDNISVQLTSVPNSAEYTALFNSYRIEKIKVTYTAEVLPSADGFFPVMYVSKWENSGLTAPTLNDFEQMNKVYKKQFSPDHRQFSITVVPYALDEFFASAITTGYAKVPSNSQWFDVGSGSGIDFYAVTGLIPAATASTNGYNFGINVDIEYTISFKDTK